MPNQRSASTSAALCCAEYHGTSQARKSRKRALSSYGPWQDVAYVTSPGVQVGQLADLAVEERAAPALIGSWLAGVPHVVVHDELAATLEHLQERDWPLAHRSA
jgi:hypothetical protein